MSNLDDLVEQAERVSSELDLIRDVLEEVRIDFQWAVQNDRLRPHQISELVESVKNQVSETTYGVQRVADNLEASTSTRQLDLFGKHVRDTFHFC